MNIFLCNSINIIKGSVRSVYDYCFNNLFPIGTLYIGD